MKSTLFTAVTICLLPALTFTSCKKKGCTDPSAKNYDMEAKKDDGSCLYDKRIFVTSAKYNGNLAGQCTSASNGLEAADCLCQKAADSAGMGNRTFKAWLSSSSQDARDRLADVGPWFLIGETDTVFSDLDDMGTEPPFSINTDEHGNVTSGRAWTGTGIGGVAIGCGAGNEWCDEWTSQFNGTGGMAGNPAAIDFQWTQDGCQNCDQVLHLICVEQ